MYNFLFPCFLFFAQRVSPFFPKWEKAFTGRAGCLDRWRKGLESCGEKIVLVHVSSVGELEQIIPVLEHWSGSKNGESKNVTFLLSYYSSSVANFLNKQGTQLFHFADYLPFDTKKSMKDFFLLFSPSLIVLNRYDLWPNFFDQARKANIPVALVNVSTPPLGYWGNASMCVRSFLFYQVRTWVYVDGSAQKAWKPWMGKDALGFVGGNSRVDRALYRLENANSSGFLDRIQKFCHSSTVVVGGSTWPRDESLLLTSFRELRSTGATGTRATGTRATGTRATGTRTTGTRTTGKIKLILVPHEPTKVYMDRLKKKCMDGGWSFVCYSEINSPMNGEESVQNADILLVDAYGFLAEIYSLGYFAYIGGGFHKGIHSIIEPIAHGLPVAFGPKYHRTAEACALVDTGAAFVASSGVDLANWIISMDANGQEKGKEIRGKIQDFLRAHQGASAKIADILQKGV